MKTAFVFAGGASLGAVEVGMLKAITEYGVKPDMILGTSVGALNGAHFSQNPTLEGVGHLEKLWNKLRVRDVFIPSIHLNQYLMSPKNLRKLIKKHLLFERIEESLVPLYIISTDVNTGNEIVFREGIVIEALMASACIPGIFPPQKMEDYVLVDGGLVNNAPISTAIKLGAERVIVFPVGLPKVSEKPPKYINEILMPSFIFQLNRQLTADYYYYKDKIDLHIIPPPNNIIVELYDFRKSEEIIEKAYIRAKKWLDDGGLKQKLDEYIKHCDVYASELIFLEAIKPEKNLIKDIFQKPH